MGRLHDNRDPETTARLELRALEQMLRAICRHTEQLTREAESKGELGSREAALQLEAFAERRAQAMEVLGDATGEPYEVRIARLEKLVDALDSSRTYFRSDDPGRG